MGNRGATISHRSIRSRHNRAVREGAPDEMPRTEGAPRTRGECVGVRRPCPWVGCRYNLFLDVRASGSLKLPHGLQPERDEADGIPYLPQSCALDVADAGPQDLKTIGRVMNVASERARQEIDAALAKLRAAAPELDLELPDEG